MNKKKIAKAFGVAVFSLTAWASVASGLQVCDLSRCFLTRDGLLLCPEGACTPVPPPKNKV